MTRILLFSGSQRRESFNTRLLAHVEFHLQWQCEVDWIHPADVDLPLFDQDMEADGAVRDKVAALLQRFAYCDALIVACPEYNGQATPFLKNTIDWVTRLSHIDARYTNPFVDKPVLLCSASTGWSGGAVALPHLRALFGYVGSNVLGCTVSIAHAQTKWSEEGFQFSDDTESQIDEALLRLLKICGQKNHERSTLPL